MKTQVLRTLALTLVFCLTVVAQGQRGKIAGVVRDAATGEQLVGANVLIKGTMLGSSTDLEGSFVILNVPPGTYDVTASMIGYGAVTQTGVDVFIDRTSQVDFALREATIEMQEVVVVAERPKIIRDQTSTAQTIDDRQIRSAPTEGIRGALELSASIQKDSRGQFSVRGSGSYDVNFQINGVSQVNTATNAPGAFGVDKADNSWKYDVNPLGVQQLQLISGGFSAEYGNAQAGIVKVVTKEGSQRFTGEARVEFRPAGQYHYGPYLYDRSNYEWQKWGNLESWMAQRRSIAEQLKLDTRYKDLFERYYVTRTASAADSAAYEELERREIAWAHSIWVKNHAPGDENPFGVYDYRKRPYLRYQVGFGGPLGRNPDLLRFFFSGEYRAKPSRLPTPEQVQIYQNYLLNVLAQPVRDHRFKLMGMYQSYRGGIWSGSDDIRWSGIAFTPPGISTKYIVNVDPVRTERTVTQTFGWTYTISNSSFFEATLAHQKETYELPYETIPSYYQMADRLDSLYDPSGSVLKEGTWWESQYFRGPFGYSTNYYQDTRTEHVSLTADYTNQVSREHLLKGGVRLYYWDMINNAVNSSFQANTFLTRSGYADYYHVYPWAAALYVQDKMEFSGMVMNLGLRAEAYNFGGELAADPFNPFYQGASGPGKLGDPATVPSKTRSIILPRLGVSFPIGESTAFRIQYGHFAAMPVFSQAFSVRTQSGWIGRGNPNLEPRKTINYEFGLQQVIQDDYRLDVALYYNDRVRQVGLQYVASYTGSRDRPAGYSSTNEQLYSYTTYANNVFGSTTGLEIVFENVSVSRWKYRLSYNLSHTTDGAYGLVTLYPEARLLGIESRPRYESLASWDRTHNFRALLLYNVGAEEGGGFFGFYPFENMNLSLTYTAQSGLPYSYIKDYDVVDIVYNRRYPLENSFDFNASKSLVVGGYRLILGLRIMNLFNNKWLTPFDVNEDRITWAETGVTFDNPGIDPTRLSYVVAPYRTYRNLPREVFFTLGFGF